MSTPSLKEKTRIIRKILQDGMALQFVPPLLQNDQETVMAAVLHDGMALQFASPSIQDDQEVVSVAVNQNGMALRFTSTKIRNDGNSVLAAVSNNGLALQFASKDLQNDEIIVRAAVSNNGLALQYASKQLQKNKQIKAIAGQNPTVYRGAEDRGSEDRGAEDRGAEDRGAEDREVESLTTMFSNIKTSKYDLFCSMYILGHGSVTVPHIYWRKGSFDYDSLVILRTNTDECITHHYNADPMPNIIAVNNSIVDMKGEPKKSFKDGVEKSVTNLPPVLVIPLPVGHTGYTYEELINVDDAYLRQLASDSVPNTMNYDKKLKPMYMDQHYAVDDLTYPINTSQHVLQKSFQPLRRDDTTTQYLPDFVDGEIYIHLSYTVRSRPFEANRPKTMIVTLSPTNMATQSSEMDVIVDQCLRRVFEQVNSDAVKPENTSIHVAIIDTVCGPSLSNHGVYVPGTESLHPRRPHHGSEGGKRTFKRKQSSKKNARYKHNKSRRQNRGL